MLQRFNFALFSKGPPVTNGKARKRGRGTRDFYFPLSGLFLRESSRVAVSFLGGRFANNLALVGDRGECLQLSLALVPLRARSFEDGSHLRRSLT